MFKKLFPLIVVLVLLAAYATYRTVQAETYLSGGSRISSVNSKPTADMQPQQRIPVTGAKTRSYPNPSTGNLQQVRSTPVPADANRWRR